MVMDKAQTHTTIKTVTSPSKTTPMTKWTQQSSKKKTGLITLQEAPKKPLIRWMIRRFDVGSRQKRMKWRMTLRIASLPNERWMVKVAEWNPELSSRYKTVTAIGRPRRKCEDDVSEILRDRKLYGKRKQIMDQSSKRPWKMDSTCFRPHDDCRGKI